MDIFTILSYLNKISLFAFVITAGFLFYQFYLLRRDSSSNPKKQPPIPDFNQNAKVEVSNYTKLPDSLQQAPQAVMKKQFNILPFVVGIALLVVTLGVFIIINSKKPATITTTNVVSPTLAVSPTVKVTNTPVPSISISPSITLTTTPALTGTPDASPTEEAALTTTPSLTPTEEVAATGTPTPSPTEVILAVISPSVTTTISPVQSSPTTVTKLPLTGMVDKGIILFSLAGFLILFAFVF